MNAGRFCCRKTECCRTFVKVDKVYIKDSLWKCLEALAGN